MSVWLEMQTDFAIFDGAGSSFIQWLFIYVVLMIMNVSDCQCVCRWQGNFCIPGMTFEFKVSIKILTFWSLACHSNVSYMFGG